MKIARRRLFLGATIACLLCGHASLQAQPIVKPIVTAEENKLWNQGVPEQNRKAAEELFQKGNELFLIPLFAKAAEQYVAALNKWKHPAFYFNLALAQLNLGKEIEAHANLERALAYGEKPLGKEQFKEAQKQLAEVKRQIGQIRV